MDGIASSNGVLIIGATNRLAALDPALVRPGRFDRVLQLSLPDEEQRLQILGVHVKRTACVGGAALLQRLAKATNGFSGAELANLVNEAAIGAVRAGRSSVSDDDFDCALGDYRRSRAPQADGNDPYRSDGDSAQAFAAFVQQAARAACSGGAASLIEENE
uniref:Vesicle-fusing ATPase n=1 Tax=Haptolina ericina TaxID=156174 RepID=A0A7S3B9V2_9EUKA